MTLTPHNIELIRSYNRTNRFSNGSPHSFKFTTDSGGGEWLLFLRAPRDEAALSLWAVAPNESSENVLVSATSITSDGPLSDAELLDNERLRRTSTGITSFTTKQDQVMFTVGGAIYVTSLDSKELVKVEAPNDHHATDAKLSPNGRRLSYLSGNKLFVLEKSDQGWANATNVAEITPQNPEALFARPEFIAAEEIGRQSGYWWVSDEQLLISEVDESQVDLLNLSDPSTPEDEPRVIRYPYAGTKNAIVQLYLADLRNLQGRSKLVTSAGEDSETEYLTNVWTSDDDCILRFQNREQTLLTDKQLDLSNGSLSTIATTTGDKWIEVLPSSRKVYEADIVEVFADGSNREIRVNNQPIETSGYVRKIISVDGESITYSASPTPDVTHVYVYDRKTASTEQLSDIDGINDLVLGEDYELSTARSLSSTQTTAVLKRAGNTMTIQDLSEDPTIEIKPDFFQVGQTSVAVFQPGPDSPHSGQASLPILMDPYGGPRAQRVIKAARAHIVSQWWADQGYIVVVAEGPGTSGADSDSEFSVYRDLASPALSAQVVALEEVTRRYPVADKSRVGIRGWSFGGYLSALAVLRRPDLFHAAVAGAPVTEWQLYDTHYTERYLGTPQDNPDAYSRSNLTPLASDLSRPLLLIHGLADDNVVPANSFRLSHSLFTHKVEHELVCVRELTHMPKKPEIVESLLIRQLQFFGKHLA